MYAAPESVKTEHAALHNVQMTKHAIADSRLAEHPIAFALAIQTALASVALTQFVSMQRLAILIETARMVVYVLRRHAVRHHLMSTLEFVFSENARIPQASSLFCRGCNMQAREGILLPTV